MGNGLIEPVPQPRIDFLVKGVDGTEQRRTEYSGMVWFGGRHAVPGRLGITMTTGYADLQTPFFLPDSHPYRRSELAGAQLAVSVSLLSIADARASIVEPIVSFVDDPRGGEHCYVQLLVAGQVRVPIGLSYRVTAVTQSNAVITE